MHVLVTGGAGFIGSHSVERLLGEGAAVRVLDNLASGKLANLPRHPRLAVQRGDIRDEAALAAAFDGVSHVLHLAAQVSVTASVAAPRESAAVNVGGFLGVLDMARRRGVERFVYASSSAVYGVPDGARSSEAAPARPISPYGLEKAVNDQYGALYAALYGMSIAGLRYFNVFGPRQDPSSPYSGVISIFVDRLRRGAPLTVHGDGGQTRDFVYVDDVARANAQALGARMGGVCNVASGRAVSLLELVEQLGRAAGRQPRLCFGPERAGDIRHSGADNARLRAELGVDSFTSLADGLARLWAAAPGNGVHHSQDPP